MHVFRHLVESLHIAHTHDKHADIGPQAKIFALIGDDHAMPFVLVQLIECGFGNVEYIRVNGIALAVKLKPKHAVAQITQTGAGIALDFGTFAQCQCIFVALNGGKAMSHGL